VSASSSNPAKTVYVVPAPQDLSLDCDPAGPLWHKSIPVLFDGDNYGRTVPGMSTTVHSCWTASSLYLLFVCPYKELNLKPEPQMKTATPNLWQWDVAEIFIALDFGRIGSYKEFEISPQAEWIDLDIDLEAPGRRGHREWSSGMQASARIDHAQSIWYGAMRIPFTAITAAPVRAGARFRANLFRSQGPQHQLMAWQPSMSDTFHVPERFGSLVLLPSHQAERSRPAK